MFSFEPGPTLRSNDLAVVADRLDDAHGPILGEAELLAEIAVGAEQRA